MMKKKEINNERKEKESRLLDTAFKLFTQKGIKDTSIQDIVDNANVAKGTFYLYFKDKYEIRDILITKKSKKLFNDALEDLQKNYIENFSDQIIFVVNHVINALSKNTLLLKFISKNLSWGVYNETVSKIYEDTENKDDSIYAFFLKGIEKSNVKIKKPDVTLYLIVELVSSTCFNSILNNKPLPIEDFKPYLFNTIRALIEEKE